MPIFDVRYVDGLTVSVEAPEGASQEQITGLANQRRSEMVQTRPLARERPPARDRIAEARAEAEARLEELIALRQYNRRKESGFMENVLSGFGAGAVNVAELGALGAAALADEEQELKARDSIQSIASALRPEGGDPESLTYGIASAFGSAVAPLGLAGLAGLAAAPLGAGAATAAALGTAGGLGIGAAAGEQSERARAAGVSEEERSRRVLQAAPIGVLEAVPFIRGAKRLFGVVEDVAQNIPRGSMQRIRSALATGGEEAATEAAAGALQNAVEQGYNPNRAILESGLAEEAGYGAVVGATIQALVDLAAGRRLRSLETPSPREEGEQLEMFPGEDLGVRPAEATEPEDAEAQLEMFTQEEMGRPPERPDERQMDLFAAREPTVRPEPEQRDFVEELETQRIDTEARERLALAAAERGDEAAFDQPDLFPLELEQTERRLGREPVEAPRAEEPTPAAPEGEQLDLVTRAEEETQLEQMQADEDAQRARQARLQAESELESLEGRRLSAQERATEERRRNILLDTIEATPSRNYTTVARAYTRTLQEQGFRDTAPTEQEVTTIQRAVNVQQAVKAPPEQIEAAPEATDLSELEAQIPERRARQEAVAPKPEVAQVTPEAVMPEGAPSEPVAAVPEPTVEPRAATPRTEPAPSGVGPADGGAVPGVVRDGGRERGARRAGAGPEVSAVVPEAPAARPVARPSVPPAEPVDRARAQPRSLETDAAALQSLDTKKGTADDAAMRAYLASGRNFDQSVRSLAYDLVTRETGAPAEDVRGIGGTPGKGGRLAPADRALRWIRSNMSPETNARLNEAIQREVEQVRRVATTTAVLQADPDSEAPIDTTSKRVELAMQMAELVSQPNPDFAAIAPVRRKLSRLLELQTALDTPLPDGATRALQGNNLSEALNNIAESVAMPRFRGMAKRLAAAVGNTNVRIQENLTNEAGTPIAGAFDPRTNTITLDAARGMNTHTVMHEMTHAATAAAIANRPNSAPVRQLKRIFNEVKDQLDTFYGTQSLDEFVSEAFSNPLFQQELAKIRVPRSPYTYWQQFKNAVTNIVRVLRGQETKSLSNTLDMTDRLVSDMLAPAPEFRNAGMLLMETTQPQVSKLAKRMDSIQKALPESTQGAFENFTASVSAFLEGAAAPKAKEWLLATLPFQALADTAEKRGVEGAFELQKAINEQEGRMAQSDEQIDVVLREAEGWMKKNPDKVDTFNNVVYTSTVEQVDPTRPQKDYEQSSENPSLNNLGKEFKPEQVEVWKQLNRDLKSMPGAQRIYTMMRDTYKTKYEQLKDVIYGRIDDIAELDDAARNTLKKEVYSRIFNEGTIDPYFPLTRTGSFWLSYSTTDGEFVVEAFESPLARDRAQMQLDSDPQVDSATLQKFQNITQASFDNAPSTSFVGQTLQVLRANRVSEETQTEIARLFIEALPESSFAKSLKRRKGKGTLGFKEDSILAMKQKAYDLGRQVERLRSAAKIRRISYGEDGKGGIQGQFGSGENKLIIEELLKRASFATNPPADNLARNANRLAFLGTIGANASSALVNLSQIPLVVVPFLSGKYGFNESMKATRDAYKIIFGSGIKRKVRLLTGETEAGDADVEVGAMPSIDNYYELDADGNFKIRDDVKLPEDPKEAQEFRERLERLRPLVQEASVQGQLNRSLFYDTLGIESSGRDRNIWDRINAWSAAAFHAVERANRQVALVSAYELELNRLETKPTKEEANLSMEEKQQRAVGTALYNAQQTNGGSVLATAPRIAQQGLGRVALMYKSYGIQMYYLQLKLFRDMLESSGLPVEQRKEAMRQLAAIQLSALMFSGVQGLTIVGMATAVANMFRDDDEEDAETSLRKYLGEGWYKGPVNQLLGVDVASRIGLSNLLFRENRFNRDPSNEETLVQALGGPAWSTTSQFLRGFQEIMEGNDLQRGLETMAPAAVKNIMKAIRVYSAGGYESRRLDPITDDISAGLLVAQAMGFAPAEYTRIQEMNSSTKGIDIATNSRRTKILRQLYVALRAGDFNEVRNLREDIREFNRDHPDPDIRITPDTVKRSMSGHMQRSIEMYNGITISPNMRRTLQRHRAEYED